MNNIDIILYINLDHRTDRNDKMICELNIFKNTRTKIVRISACKYPKQPEFGCILSHIVALKCSLIDENNNNILILEDDFTFIRSKEEIDLILTEFFKRTVDWDCILLSYDVEKRIPYDDLISRVRVAHMASGYLIKRSAVPSLVELYQESAGMLFQSKNNDKFAADTAWENLMLNDKWFIFNERLGIQGIGYSDITVNFRNNSADQGFIFPKTYVIHNGQSHSIGLLRKIFEQNFVQFYESPNPWSLNEQFEIVILLDTDYTEKDF